MMYGYYGGWWPMMLFGGILNILFWILIVWLIVSLVRGRRWRRWEESMGRGRALDILEERYAKGEINKEEFEAKKKDLMH